jgi:D-alanine-D-alanine ligase
MREWNIGVLLDGLSTERQTSLESGQAVLAALHARGYDARPVLVDRDLDRALRAERIEAAFIALPGAPGESGCVQGLLEALAIPYTGSDLLASALAGNKVRAKQILRLCNLPTPPAYAIPADLPADELLARHGDFGFPVVVKPVSGCASVGVSVAADPDQLVEACQRAAGFDHQLLVERFIEGHELSIAVLDDRVLGAIDVKSAHPLSRARIRGLRHQAVMAHRALGCSGATLVDVIVSPTGNESILEVNTAPSLTAADPLPRIAHAAGVSFEDLILAILLGASQRSPRRRPAGIGAPTRRAA